MKKQLPPIIGWILLLIAFSVYVYGIVAAIWYPLNPDDITKIHIPEPLDSITATLGAILLTNLGAVLGISVANPKSALAGMTLIGRNKIDIPDPVTQRDVIQYAAVILYLLVLVACFIKWACTSFREPPTPIVAIVAQNGKILIGVIVAYAAFVLGVSKPPANQ